MTFIKALDKFTFSELRIVKRIHKKDQQYAA